jgi:hypothetical protein
MIFEAISFWQPMTTIITMHLFGASISQQAGMAGISLFFSSTSCPMTRWFSRAYGRLYSVCFVK